MPSPCAALTSAPCLRSCRTLAVSPRMAASAIWAWLVVAPSVHTARAKSRPLAEPALRSVSDVGLGMTSGMGRQVESARAIAEVVHIVDAERVENAQHRVGHRRAVGRLEVQVACQLAVRFADEEQRTPAMVVQVRIAHR